MVQVLILNTNISIFDNTETHHGEFTALGFWNQRKNLIYIISKFSTIKFYWFRAKLALCHVSPVTGKRLIKRLRLKIIEGHHGTHTLCILKLKINVEIKLGNADFPWCWKDHLSNNQKREKRNGEKSQMKTTSVSKQPIRWSRDGRAGGHRASTSSHVGHPSGHPPGTGGGLLTPKERGRSPMRPGRTLRERKSGGGTWPASLRGCWERGGVRTIGGAHPWYGELWGQEKTFGGWGDQRGREPAFSRLLRSRQPAGVGGWISTLWVLSLSTPPWPFLATQVWSLSSALPRAFTGRVDPGPKPPAPRPPLATRIPGLNLLPTHYQGLFHFLFFSCWCTVLLHCFYVFVFFYGIFFYFSTFIFLFTPVWCPFLWHAVQLARSWFPGWGLDWSSCGGSTESKPLD